MSGIHNPFLGSHFALLLREWGKIRDPGNEVDVLMARNFC